MVTQVAIKRKLHTDIHKLVKREVPPNLQQGEHIQYQPKIFSTSPYYLYLSARVKQNRISFYIQTYFNWFKLYLFTWVRSGSGSAYQNPPFAIFINWQSEMIGSSLLPAFFFLIFVIFKTFVPFVSVSVVETKLQNCQQPTRFKSV